MYEFYKKFRAGARVFELFENMPARAPAKSDPQKTCRAGPRAGPRGARAPARRALLTLRYTRPRPRAGPLLLLKIKRNKMITR